MTSQAPLPGGSAAVADLLRVLDLTPAHQVDPADAGAAAESAAGHGDEEFLGASQPTPHKRVFGGQVIAQAMVAAGRTLTDGDGPDRALHSLHGYFLRPGDADEPIRFQVERLHDGGSFSARRVHAVQYGRPILALMLSFQTPADGMDHQGEMPAVPMPEMLPTLADQLVDVPAGPMKQWALDRALDLRYCEGSLYLGPGEQRVRTQNVWFRTITPLPDDRLLHQAVLAFASDYPILEATLRRHGIGWPDRRLRAASLDHAMWFHRPARIDDWLLYSSVAPSASGGRGLGLASVFTREGTLVATVAQEGMLRLKD